MMENNEVVIRFIDPTCKTRPTLRNLCREVLRVLVPFDGDSSFTEEQCCVCMGRIANASLDPCGHPFCKDCADMFGRCPNCRAAPISVIERSNTVNAILAQLSSIGR